MTNDSKGDGLILNSLSLAVTSFGRFIAFERVLPYLIMAND